MSSVPAFNGLGARRKSYIVRDGALCGGITTQYDGARSFTEYLALRISHLAVESHGKVYIRPRYGMCNQRLNSPAPPLPKGGSGGFSLGRARAEVPKRTRYGTCNQRLNLPSPPFGKGGFGGIFFGTGTGGGAQTESPRDFTKHGTV